MDDIEGSCLEAIIVNVIAIGALTYALWTLTEYIRGGYGQIF